MAGVTEIRVPDIGDFSDVPVIEVLVGVGDRIRPEDPLVTLESDKATMDVPSPTAGTVVDIALSVGDLVSEGGLILTLESAESVASSESADSATPMPAPAPTPPVDPVARAIDTSTSTGASTPDPRAPRGRPSPTASLANRTAAAPALPCHTRDAALRPRARCRPRESPRHRAQGTNPPRGHQRLREARTGHPPAREHAGRDRHSTHPGRGLRQVRRNRDAPARTHQAHLGPAPAPLVGERPARHQPRRGRRDGPRSVPPVDQGRGGGRRRAHHPPRLRDEGGGGDARRVPTFNASLGPEGDTLVIKKYVHARHRGGHPERTHGAGAARRRPQGRVRPRPRDGGTR